MADSMSITEVRNQHGEVVGHALSERVGRRVCITLVFPPDQTPPLLTTLPEANP